MLMVMGTIFALSHQPGLSLTLLDFDFSDKFCHFAAYGILGVTVMYGFAGPQAKKNPLPLIITAICLSLLYGISDEYHQSFIQGRYASLSDVVADLFGAAVFCPIFARFDALYRGFRPFC